MRPIDADALLNDSSIVYHTEFGDAVVDVEDIKKAPTIKTFTLADIEEQYRKGMEKGLEEAETKKCPIFSDDEVKQPCVKSPCDICNHMGEHDAVDPYGEPYCPIDRECENASRYEKKEGEAE